MSDFKTTFPELNLAQRKALIRLIEEKVIGKNRPIRTGMWTGISTESRAQDLLRATQRTQLNKLINGDK